MTLGFREDLKSGSYMLGCGDFDPEDLSHDSL